MSTPAIIEYEIVGYVVRADDQSSPDPLPSQYRTADKSYQNGYRWDVDLVIAQFYPTIDAANAEIDRLLTLPKHLTDAYIDKDEDTDGFGWYEVLNKELCDYYDSELSPFDVEFVIEPILKAKPVVIRLLQHIPKNCNAQGVFNPRYYDEQGNAKRPLQ